MGTFGRTSTTDRALRLLERPGIDYVAMLLLLGAALAGAQRSEEVDPLGGLSGDDRLALYGHLLTAISLSLALAGVALAVYTGATGPRVTLLRAVAGARLRRQFTGALTGPALSAAAILTAFVLQAGGDAWSRWIAVGAIAFLGARTARLIYFFTALLREADEDHEPEVAEKLANLDDQPLRRRR